MSGPQLITMKTWGDRPKATWPKGEEAIRRTCAWCVGAPCAVHLCSFHEVIGPIDDGIGCEGFALASSRGGPGPLVRLAPSV